MEAISCVVTIDERSCHLVLGGWHDGRTPGRDLAGPTLGIYHLTDSGD
jgi:hypothetical protein